MKIFFNKKYFNNMEKQKHTKIFGFIYYTYYNFKKKLIINKKTFISLLNMN